MGRRRAAATGIHTLSRPFPHSPCPPRRRVGDVGNEGGHACRRAGAHGKPVPSLKHSLNVRNADTSRLQDPREEPGGKGLALGHGLRSPDTDARPARVLNPPVSASDAHTGRRSQCEARLAAGSPGGEARGPNHRCKVCPSA